MAETSRAMLWFFIVILVAITAFSFYKLLILKESAFIQFTFVAALSGAVLRQLPLFVKYKYLNVIPAAGAVIFFVLAILEAIKN